LATDKLTAATDKDKMFNLIVEERKLEFAGEALRKVDLMRWGILSEKMAEAKQKMLDLANRSTSSITDFLGNPYDYSKYLDKVYYVVGMEHTIDQVGENDYTIYGMEAGDDETTAKGTGADNRTSTFVFSLADTNAQNVAKVQKYIDTFYMNDPDSKMFWPIWQVFINSSNGMLNNDGY
jgi:hypothetical protein